MKIELKSVGEWSMWIVFKRWLICKEEKISLIVKFFDIDNELFLEYIEFDNFYSVFDKEVIESLSIVYNCFLDLFIIVLLVIMFLVFCFLILYFYVLLVNFLWLLEEFVVVLDINDVVVCFFVFVGLVYVIFFGFVF